MDLNKVMILGRVTADPQLRTTPGGQSVVTIGVATNRTWMDKSNQKQEETEFHNVVIWGRQAEVAAQYLTKGAMVLIEGRLRTRAWTDKNGQSRRTTEVMSERMQLGPRAANAGGAGGGMGSAANGGFRSGGVGVAPANVSGADIEAKEPAGAPPLEDIPSINLDEEEIKAEDIPF